MHPNPIPQKLTTGHFLEILRNESFLEVNALACEMRQAGVPPLTPIQASVVMRSLMLKQTEAALNVVKMQEAGCDTSDLKNLTATMLDDYIRDTGGQPINEVAKNCGAARPGAGKN